MSKSEDSAQPFQIYTKDQINDVIRQKTEELADELSCSFDLARAYLLANRWDKSAVAESLAKDKNYIENTFKYDPKEAQKTICGLKQEAEDSTITCGICYDDCDEKDIIQVSECGHRACFECVQDYCKAKMGMGNDDSRPFGPIPEKWV